MADINTGLGVNLPFNLEAEQSVLGSMLIDPECLPDVFASLKAEAFYLERHKVIFNSMLIMNSARKPIDPVIIADELAKEGHYDVAGGREYLVQLAQSVPSTTNIKHYVEIVNEQYLLKTLITVAQDIIDDATSGEAEAGTVLDRAQQLIYNINQGKENNGLEKLSKIIINDVYTRLDKITGDEKEKYKGIPTGFGLLDKYLSGLNKSDFILIGARPAMGKTSFALNLAHNITMLAKKRCAFFSLEMTKEQLAERLLSSQAGVESQKLRKGELSVDEWTRLGNATGQFENVELYLDDSSSITVPEIKSKVMRLRNVDCVIIDYLGLIKSAVKKENRVQEVSDITRNLKMMAKDLNIPVVCCAQLSRATEGHGKNHKPQLADLRESGSIEQDADIVMFLYRPDYYKNDVPEEKQDEIDAAKTELIIAKNRHGATETVELVFDKEYTRFRAVDKSTNF